MKLGSWRRTQITGAQHFCLIAKFNFETAIKDIQRSLPEAFVSKLFAVANNATINLVDLFESAVFHNHGQHFTTNAAGAIRNNWFVFEVVIFPALNFGNKIWCCLNIGDDCIFKSADACFVCTSAVEENNVVSAFGNELVDLGRLEVHAAANDSIFIDLDFLRNTKRHYLVAHANFDSWKIIADAIRPLEVDGLESRKLFGDAHIFFDR